MGISGQGRSGIDCLPAGETALARSFTVTAVPPVCCHVFTNKRYFRPLYGGRYNRYCPLHAILPPAEAHPLEAPKQEGVEVQLKPCILPSARSTRTVQPLCQTPPLETGFLFHSLVHSAPLQRASFTPHPRSRSSSGLTSRRGPPSTAASDCGNPRDDKDHDTNEFGNNNQSPPDTPDVDDGHRPTSNGEEGGGEPEVGGLLGKEFDEEVERQRAKEVAAEWGRKRGSGKRTKTREKVNTRQPPQEKLSYERMTCRAARPCLLCIPYVRTSGAEPVNCLLGRVCLWSCHMHHSPFRASSSIGFGAMPTAVSRYDFVCKWMLMIQQYWFLRIARVLRMMRPISIFAR